MQIDIFSNLPESILLILIVHGTREFRRFVLKTQFQKYHVIIIFHFLTIVSVLNESIKQIVLDFFLTQNA